VFLITFLQHCAQALLDFNGGASCVQVYVNQHDFFLNRVQKDVQSDDTILSVLYDDITGWALIGPKVALLGRPRYYSSKKRVKSDRVTQRDSRNGWPRGTDRTGRVSKSTLRNASLLTASIRTVGNHAHVLLKVIILKVL